jgi:hypothetical protein
MFVRVMIVLHASNYRFVYSTCSRINKSIFLIIKKTKPFWCMYVQGVTGRVHNFCMIHALSLRRRYGKEL